MSPHQIVFLFIALLASILTAYLFVSRKKNPIVDCYLLSLLIILLFRFLLNSFPSILNNSQLVHDILVNQLRIFSIILFYLHLLRLTKNKKLSSKQVGLHLFFSIISLPLTLFISKQFFQGENINRIETSLLLIYTLLYLVNSTTVLSTHLKLKKKNKLPNTIVATVKHKWTVFLFFGYLILSIVTLFIVFNKMFYNKEIFTICCFWVSIIIWLYSLVRIITEPMFLLGVKNIEQKIDKLQYESNPTKSYWNLSAPHIKNKQDLILSKKVKHKLKDYIDCIEVFFDEDFNHPEEKFNTYNLSHKLNIPESHIRYLFKHHCNYNYSHYVTVKRIQKAIHLLMNNSKDLHTLEKISVLVGYPNYNTFFTNFKKVSGCSPKQYLKKHSLKKEEEQL